MWNVRNAPWRVADWLTGFRQHKYGSCLRAAERKTRSKLRKYQLANIIAVCAHYGYEITSWQDFKDMPLTSKIQLPVNPPEGNDYSTQTTSGSTGEPRTIYIPWQTWHRKDAVFHRSWERLGREPRHKVLRIIEGEPKYAWYDRLRNDHVINRDDVEGAYLWIIENRPFLIHGAGLPIREILEMVIRRGHADKIRNTRVEWCSVSSEGHRERLEPYLAGFYEQYGLAELPTVASPCLYNMHLVMETGYAEIIDGEIVVTDFLNGVTPIIRYRTGDAGYIAHTYCRCGLPSQTLHEVKGRRCDYYDGPEVKRSIGWWLASPLGHHYPCVAAYYLNVYPAYGNMILNLKPADGWNEEMAKEDLEPYAKWAEAETGLRVLYNFNSALPVGGWKRHLVRVYE